MYVHGGMACVLYWKVLDAGRSWAYMVAHWNGHGSLESSLVEPGPLALHVAIALLSYRATV